MALTRAAKEGEEIFISGINRTMDGGGIGYKIKPKAYVVKKELAVGTSMKNFDNYGGTHQALKNYINWGSVLPRHFEMFNTLEEAQKHYSDCITWIQSSIDSEISRAQKLRLDFEAERDLNKAKNKSNITI